MTRSGFVLSSAGALAALALTIAPGSGLAAMGVSDEVTVRVVVRSVDTANRRLLVTRPDGTTLSMRVPQRFRNFERLRPGDRIKATYYRAIEFEMTPHGAAPMDRDTLVTGRARKGDLPGGVIENHVVVTGAIVGIDRKANTVKIVSPHGGAVQEFAVESADGRRALQRLKVGDKITARITESLLVSTRPA